VQIFKLDLEEISEISWGVLEAGGTCNKEGLDESKWV
jgi:hypothetical protein